MRKQDFKQIGSHLLASLPTGMVAKGELVIACPLRDALRGIAFEAALEPTKFYVNGFWMPLYVPAESVYFNFGRRVRGHGEQWDVTSPDLLPTLSMAVLQQAIPIIAGASTVEQQALAADSIARATNDLYAHEAAAFAMARLGRVPQAISALARVLAILDPEVVGWHRVIASRAGCLKGALESDPARAAHMLSEWRLENIHRLRLDDLADGAL